MPADVTERIRAYLRARGIEPSGPAWAPPRPEVSAAAVLDWLYLEPPIRTDDGPLLHRLFADTGGGCCW